MGEIRHLHQSDAEARVLASGRVFLYPDAPRWFDGGGSRLVLARHSGPSAGIAERASQRVQGERGIALLPLPPGHIGIVGRLLLDLSAAGVELAAHPTDGARLRYRPATLAPDLSARLRLHRAEVLGLLLGEYGVVSGEAGYVLSERLGVADGLGMPTHPGSAAWLVALGESMGDSCH